MQMKHILISTLIAAAAMGLSLRAETKPLLNEQELPADAKNTLALADEPAAEDADAAAEETQDADALELLLADDALVELDEAAAPDELSTETMMREWIARYAAAARFAGIRSVKGTGGGLSSGGAVATAGADLTVSAAAPTPSVSVPAAGTVSLADTLTRASAAGVSLDSARASDAGTVSVATASSASGTSTILPAAFFSTRGVFSAVPAATASYSLAGSSGNTISVTISNSARDLIWSGATNTTWDTESANWKTSAEATESTKFKNYDSVTFNGDATVTVTSGGVTAGTVTVSSGTLVLSGGTVTASALAGSGTIQLGSLTGLSVGTANDANRFAAWTGTVAFKNISGVSGVGLNLRNYGNENSKIVFDGVSGKGIASNQGLWFEGETFASDIEIGENGLTLTNGSGSWTTTFSGALSGTGTFYHSHTTTQTYIFTGDVRKFTGTLKSTTATFKFEGTENQTFAGAIIGDGTTGAKVAKAGSTTLTLNNANTQIADLRISAGTLNLNAGEATLSVATKSLSGGTLNIGSDATVKVAVSDAVNWNGTASIDVAGALALNNGVHISLGANNSLSLSGGRITGAGDAHGALDFFGGVHTINVTEDSAIAAVIRPRDNSLKFNVNDQKTLTVSGAVRYSNGENDDGTIEKLGDGILDFTNTVAVNSITQTAGTLNINGTATFGSLTQNAGTLTIGGATTVTGNYTGSSGTDKYSVLTVNAGASLSVGGDLTLRQLNNNNTGATMDVSGEVSVDGNFWIARDGKGIVNIYDGGTVVANTLTFGQAWDGASEKGSTVNLEEGGTLVVGTVVANTTAEGTNTPALNASALNLKGGTLGTSEESLEINVTKGAEALSVVLGTGTTSTINTGKYDTSTKTFKDTEAEISIANEISGDGALKKTGAGMLTLSGANTYTGGTTIENGTLVAGSASALGKGTVTVGADGKLGIAAGVTITEVSGGIELADGAKIVVDLSDRLSETKTFEVTLATNTAISLAAETALAYSEGDAKDLTDYLELKGWNKSGWTSSLTYANETLTLTMTIPEPSLFGLLAGVTALGFSMSSRRRRKKP